MVWFRVASVTKPLPMLKELSKNILIAVTDALIGVI
jgi:hypothetical protein